MCSSPSRFRSPAFLIKYGLIDAFVKIVDRLNASLLVKFYLDWWLKE